jgi:hypothetical protein
MPIISDATTNGPLDIEKLTTVAGDKEFTAITVKHKTLKRSTRISFEFQNGARPRFKYSLLYTDGAMRPAELVMTLCDLYAQLHRQFPTVEIRDHLGEPVTEFILLKEERSGNDQNR